jgi:hypothetical protein
MNGLARHLLIVLALAISAGLGWPPTAAQAGLTMTAID